MHWSYFFLALSHLFNDRIEEDEDEYDNKNRHYHIHGIPGNIPERKKNEYIIFRK